MTTYHSQKLLLFAAMVSVGLCLVTSSVADTIYDTTGIASGANHLVGSNGGTINQPANSFVVSGGSFTLDSITLELASTTINSGGTPDDYEIRLWDNDVNKPGTLLESFTVAGSDMLVGDTTVLSTLHVLLSNGSTYWVSAALPDDLSFGLVRIVSATSPRAIAFSGSQTPTWISSGTGNTFRMLVTGTPVPEPTSLLLMSTLIASALCLQRPSRHR